MDHGLRTMALAFHSVQTLHYAEPLPLYKTQNRPYLDYGSHRWRGLKTEIGNPSRERELTSNKTIDVLEDVIIIVLFSAG